MPRGMKQDSKKLREMERERKRKGKRKRIEN